MFEGPFLRDAGHIGSLQRATGLEVYDFTKSYDVTICWNHLVQTIQTNCLATEGCLEI